MEVQLEGLLDRITDFIENESKTDTVVGKEFKLGSYSCVPVIRIGTGFGTGGGDRGDSKSNGELGGAGAGIGIEPIGFLVTKGDEINFIGVTTTSGITAAIEKVPGLVSKYMDTKNKENKKKPVPA